MGKRRETGHLITNEYSSVVKSPRLGTVPKKALFAMRTHPPAVCGIQKAFPRFTAQKGKRSKLYKIIFKETTQRDGLQSARFIYCMCDFGGCLHMRHISTFRFRGNAANQLRTNILNERVAPSARRTCRMCTPCGRGSDACCAPWASATAVQRPSVA